MSATFNRDKLDALRSETQGLEARYHQLSDQYRHWRERLQLIEGRLYEAERRRSRPDSDGQYLTDKSTDELKTILAARRKDEHAARWTTSLEDLAQLIELREITAKLYEQREQVGARNQHVSTIVSKCEEFLRARGVRLDQTSNSSLSVNSASGG